MAIFEREEYRTEHEFPDNAHQRPFVVRSFESFRQFMDVKRTYAQLMLHLQLFWAREEEPKNPNLFRWPTCPCGQQISRATGDYPLGIGQLHGCHFGPILSDLQTGWTVFCTVCDGLVVRHPGFMDDVWPEKGELRFRKALGLGGKETVREDWREKGMKLRDRGELMPFDERTQGHLHRRMY